MIPKVDLGVREMGFIFCDSLFSLCRGIKNKMNLPCYIIDHLHWKLETFCRYTASFKNWISYVQNHCKFWTFTLVVELTKIELKIIERRHDISNNVVCATSKGSDQPAHMCSLIRAFASRLSILWVLSYWLNIIWSFYAEPLLVPWVFYEF